MLAILIIGVLLPYTDPNLLRNEATDVGVSPFALVFQHAGLAFAAGMMNAVVLTALLSSGTSSLYVSTRILYDLSLEGQAPRWFAKVSANGVPHRALLATSAVGALCFFSSLFGDQVVYLWLLNTSAVTCFIAWFGIALAHYRFRKVHEPGAFRGATGVSVAVLPVRADHGGDPVRGDHSWAEHQSAVCTRG